MFCQIISNVGGNTVICTDILMYSSFPAFECDFELDG